MKIKLYHNSNAKIDKITVDNYGNGLYTNNDIKASTLNRSFFYTEPEPQETRFKGCKYCYIVEVKASRLYDLRTDNAGLINKFSTPCLDIDKLLNYIKSQFYIGIIYNVGFDISCLFYSIKPVEKIIRN